MRSLTPASHYAKELLLVQPVVGVKVRLPLSFTSVSVRCIVAYNLDLPSVASPQICDTAIWLPKIFAMLEYIGRRRPSLQEGESIDFSNINSAYAKGTIASNGMKIKGRCKDVFTAIWQWDGNFGSFAGLKSLYPAVARNCAKVVQRRPAAIDGCPSTCLAGIEAFYVVRYGEILPHRYGRRGLIDW